MGNKHHLYSINIKLAGHVVRICTEYHISPKMYKAFRTTDDADLCIVLENEDIDFTLAEHLNTNRIQVITPSILQKVSDALLCFDIILMHGAVIALNEGAYMFTAVSGTGKTTHILKWLNRMPNAYVVNGDKPFIKLNNDGSLPFACGSPWAGKENLYTNTMVPLKAIILMERSENNHIEQISFAEAFPILLQQTNRPEDPEMMRKTLQLLRRLHPVVKFYRFQCNNFKDDCFDVSYNALVGTQSD